MDLTSDHRALEDAYETRRYFAKFERIIDHLKQVAEQRGGDKDFRTSEVKILHHYLNNLANTFTTLSYKYLLTGRISDLLPASMNIDRSESGFPIYQEMLQMASDAMQAENHLQSLPDLKKLKQDMVRHILSEHSAPTQLQFAACQRLYYAQLAQGDLFGPQNDPRAKWLGETPDNRLAYRLYWAIYDSQQNIPIIYLMDVEDSGRTPLVKDERRWPRVQSHLMAQSPASLKLLTIANGFDEDFDDLHPKRLRRIYIGPMYSHEFTLQNGPLREVLAETGEDAALDWALAWTVESLHAVRSEMRSSGFFSEVERQIYQLDPLGELEDGNDGISEQRRSLILPLRPFQILQERNPPGFANIRKYVVSPGGKILSYK